MAIVRRHKRKKKKGYTKVRKHRRKVKKKKVVETPPMKRLRENRGYTEIVEVDAKKLADRFKKDQKEDIVWSEGRFKSAMERDEVDSYPHVDYNKELGRLGVTDGRHRIGAAAKKGEKIKIAVTPQKAWEDLDEDGIVNIFDKHQEELKQKVLSDITPYEKKGDISTREERRLRRVELSNQLGGDLQGVVTATDVEQIEEEWKRSEAGMKRIFKEEKKDKVYNKQKIDQLFSDSSDNIFLHGINIKI